LSIVVTPGSPRTYLFDQTRPEARLARALVDDRLQRADGRVDKTAVVDRSLHEPGGRYIDFLVPGLLGMNIMSGAFWGIGYAIVDMRSKKLVKRMLATPMHKSHLLASFVLMSVVVALAGLPVLLVFGRLAFDVEVQGSLATLAGVGLLGSLAFSALGLLVAAR